jgi:hypothetical protein
MRIRQGGLYNKTTLPYSQFIVDRNYFPSQEFFHFIFLSASWAERQAWRRRREYIAAYFQAITGLPIIGTYY